MNHNDQAMREDKFHNLSDLQSKINKMEHILNIDQYKMIGGAKKKKSKKKKTKGKKLKGKKQGEINIKEDKIYFLSYHTRALVSSNNGFEP